MIDINIRPCDNSLLEALQHKINSKTKPAGALGMLESIALQVGLIQNTLTPALLSPNMVVFAADHGIANEGVSAYPQEVTGQMVLNFLSGGAAINVFCRQHGIELAVVDAGVTSELPAHPLLIDKKMGAGTDNFLFGPAMTQKQCEQALMAGMKIVEEIADKGCNIIGFGEMGIGNTSAASMLTHILCDIPLLHCVGKGTGLDDDQRRKKLSVLEQASQFHRLTPDADPIQVLSTFGGFEIAMMTGAMLKAAQKRIIILVDGFIASAAFLAAHALQPTILAYSFFTHLSEEQGHIKAMEFLRVRPILQLNMRLGEGTGAAIAYPIIQSAVNFLNEMASFEEARVSTKFN
ncbi:Nicotinate-nucleotide--dimethylbenzimidazole phosphoribosyltransferase [Fulvivirga imtechensis AK7]|uniref:Nicotinate-nucleotide--dimethylbenzimidazole phosphoribosyltransferase n=1 Tax=Fulvivirga imtechensis AK7 TaxID=1237149 RepID=L8JRX0_9BACT|nr:nicotinate-nucleotide--dimethylbenzimidazole phosphoribosyltransferase [Fulvivirga imtechensis]ELR70117.1 Nicotinate-nucleotide--dimethylbenzimidazole phosphoribosyltransferase [Fulvivirga imtechensis AK7]